MYYTNNIPYYSNNMYNFRGPSVNTYSYSNRYPNNNRLIGGAGGFAVPFALGFLSAPLLLRPNYYPYGYNPYYRPYYRPYY